MSQINIRPSSGLWTIHFGGALIGKSQRVLELCEGTHLPVLYFPRQDIAMDLLERGDLVTTCRHKGKAIYFHIVTPATRAENAVWSYEAPKQPMGVIAGYLAFQPDCVMLRQERGSADLPGPLGT